MKLTMKIVIYSFVVVCVIDWPKVCRTCFHGTREFTPHEQAEDIQCKQLYKTNFIFRLLNDQVTLSFVSCAFTRLWPGRSWLSFRFGRGPAIAGTLSGVRLQRRFRPLYLLSVWWDYLFWLPEMNSESGLWFTLTQIISALPQLYGREAEVIVRCTKMLHNRRDYLRRRAKVSVHRLKDLISSLLVWW